MSFAGRGIVVTRPRELAQSLAALIERRGARPIVFPAIEIEKLPPPAVLHDIAQYDMAIFVSPSAARVALPAIGPWPASVAAAAVGGGTRRELERAGIERIVSPQEGADSEALLALSQMRDMAGKRVLIVRGEGGRPVLAEALELRGARVDYAECYRRRRPSVDASPLTAAWQVGEVDALTISSSEGFDNLAALLGNDAPALLGGTPAFVPHARVASHVRSRVRDAIIAGPGDDQLVERLVAYFDERP
jgi:uroporphyrinogen-III synthase